MSEQEPTQDEMVEAIYAFASEQMNNGVPDRDIRANLEDQGLDADSAEAVVANLGRMRKEANQEAGRKNMMYGLLWCVGGALITAVTYSAAANGGTYVVTWGAIVFGAIQFFQGLFQASRD